MGAIHNIYAFMLPRVADCYLRHTSASSVPLREDQKTVCRFRQFRYAPEGCGRSTIALAMQLPGARCPMKPRSLSDTHHGLRHSAEHAPR